MRTKLFSVLNDEPCQCCLQFCRSVVNDMSAHDRAKLLAFCTGSPRAPATGFASLMGYSGRLHKFHLQILDGGVDRLPVASTLVTFTLFSFSFVPSSAVCSTIDVCAALFLSQVFQHTQVVRLHQSRNATEQACVGFAGVEWF